MCSEMCPTSLSDTKLRRLYIIIIMGIIKRAVGFVATEDMSAAGISRKIMEVIEPLQLDPSLLIQAGDGDLSSSSTLHRFLLIQWPPGRI